jgi:pumilio family protein 6
MQESLLPCIQKDLLSSSIVHRAMHEYLRNANEKGREELIDAVKEKLIKMIHSRDGARVAMYCLWYGTNKVYIIFLLFLINFILKFRIENY